MSDPQHEHRPDLAPPPSPDVERDVAQRIEEMPPQEGARLLQEMDHEVSANVTEYLDPNTAAEVLVEMEPVEAADVIGRMEMAEASMVLAAMDPDDRVDILEHVPDKLHDELLTEMTPEEAQETRDLEQYPHDTAGGIMTTQVTALREDFTVEEAIAELRRQSEQLEQMFYVYVVDKREHLVGVLSMRDLILARPERRLSGIMRPNVLAVPVTMDQEEVAALFRKFNYLAMPVVDPRNRLLGIITVDDVVHVLEEEATEDVHRLFGAGVEERLGSPWHFSFRKRVGWLVINLATAFMAAAVVGAFADTIQALAILAAYMPIVAGTGGNAGAQTLAVTIRGLAVGRVDRNLLRHVLRREVIVGTLSGAVLGALTAVIAVVFNQNPKLGLVIFMALVINHVLATTTASTIPILLKRLGFDPAQSATIFATTVTDVCGFFALLGLAKWILM